MHNLCHIISTLQIVKIKTAKTYASPCMKITVQYYCSKKTCEIFNISVYIIMNATKCWYECAYYIYNHF